MIPRRQVDGLGVEDTQSFVYSSIISATSECVTKSTVIMSALFGHAEHSSALPNALIASSYWRSSLWLWPPFNAVLHAWMWTASLTPNSHKGRAEQINLSTVTSWSLFIPSFRPWQYFVWIRSRRPAKRNTLLSSRRENLRLWKETSCFLFDIYSPLNR